MINPVFTVCDAIVCLDYVTMVSEIQINDDSTKQFFLIISGVAISFYSENETSLEVLESKHNDICTYVKSRGL